MKSKPSGRVMRKDADNWSYTSVATLKSQLMYIHTVGSGNSVKPEKQDEMLMIKSVCDSDPISTGD